ncbi:MAG: hypothetical protein A2381_11170 [Bdellovibrionales bacterium RIFOXYB1_FULL_37_110]|nr:MAG: hypothetical protein A2181_01490 [Bdellovibrionales bacterium RIFOXYA1_FULL_38_20]OFZ48601.1 MAG: hypothetical protein A2417_09655 [Bdellovibrionales bacterium RIFOXYC1_FULL_37_79]OFZ58410.1 MAG: hypothetical protein A2381_11170 [Bdellovibrionales bacterium RIFOXYB1_FULL_37_110]OFZ61454.1 MAG: hypothetical protein A2577_00090 [Bdellovibrionales bacterium RIFOXYD1_FULL_36_51]
MINSSKIKGRLMQIRTNNKVFLIALTVSLLFFLLEAQAGTLKYYEKFKPAECTKYQQTDEYVQWQSKIRILKEQRLFPSLGSTGLEQELQRIAKSRGMLEEFESQSERDRGLRSEGRKLAQLGLNLTIKLKTHALEILETDQTNMTTFLDTLKACALEECEGGCQKSEICTKDLPAKMASLQERLKLMRQYLALMYITRGDLTSSDLVMRRLTHPKAVSYLTKQDEDSAEVMLEAFSPTELEQLTLKMNRGNTNGPEKTYLSIISQSPFLAHISKRELTPDELIKALNIQNNKVSLAKKTINHHAEMLYLTPLLAPLVNLNEENGPRTCAYIDGLLDNFNKKDFAERVFFASINFYLLMSAWELGMLKAMAFTVGSGALIDHIAKQNSEDFFTDYSSFCASANYAPHGEKNEICNMQMINTLQKRKLNLLIENLMLP